MEINEEKTTNTAKKIRNHLIYFIHLELIKKNKHNQNILINSMTSKELNAKYQKYSDFCVETIETYNSCHLNNQMANNNYYIISITYCSLNNIYNMIIDNKSTEKMIETNNIIGKYYKGNSVNIKTTTNNVICKINQNADQNLNYNFIKNENESNLEKIVIGNKKFLKHRKLILSSFQITKNILLNDNENENNDNDNDFLSNLNSNLNNNYIKLINSNINDNNNINIETNFQHKLKKANNQKLIHLYANKLKLYCYNLKIMKKKAINHIKNSKLNESSSQGNKIVKKDTIKEKNKNHVTILVNKDLKDKESNNQKNKNNIQNKIQNQTIHTNIKNHTKVNDKKNPVKIIHKKSIHISKAQSTDKTVEELISLKKMVFPSKQIINNEKTSKYPKKNKRYRGSNTLNKNISCRIIRKTKFLNRNNNMKSNNIMNSNNDLPSNIIKLNALNAINSKKSNNIKIKRANSGINRLYLVRRNGIKLKESIDV